MLDHGHDKYITTRELKKLRTGNFAVRSAQTELATRDKPLISQKRHMLKINLKK